MEKFRDVFEHVPCFGNTQFVAVFFVKCCFFLGIFKPIFAIGPSNGVTLQRHSPILARPTRILGITGDGGRRHGLVHSLFQEPIGQIDIVTLGGTGPQPL